MGAASRAELHYIHEESDLYLNMSVFQSVCPEELYISKSCMQQVLYTTYRPLIKTFRAGG